MTITQHRTESARHRTAWIEAGPREGPLMIFLHGWPETGIVWRNQIEHFAAAGWRCVAPDMRGYGGSSVPTTVSAYAVPELVQDMVELHDALGGEPAIWVGHDWGSPVVWAMAAHRAERCRAVVNLCVPYFARGFALPNLLPLIDRETYPIERYPVGQWDYWLYYRERFAEAAQQFEADVPATINALYRRGTPDAIGKPAITANVRANGGWFGNAGRAPAVDRASGLLREDDYRTLVDAFGGTGFEGANAWYLNDGENLTFAATAPDFGRLYLPVLFLHAAWDTVCETMRSDLAAPMRKDCDDLTDVVIEAGHELQLECPTGVNLAIAEWLSSRRDERSARPDATATSARAPR